MDKPIIAVIGHDSRVRIIVGFASIPSAERERKKGKGEERGEGRETSRNVSPSSTSGERLLYVLSGGHQSDAWVVRPPSRDRVIVVCLPGDVTDTKNYYRAYERETGAHAAAAAPGP